MPRTARASVGGVCYHIINRGNARTAVFHEDEDYSAFIQLLTDSLDHVSMRVVSYCLMPNHFHMVVWPREDSDLSRWMQWLLTAHVRRHHRHHHGSGHVWQGRFKAFPIQQDAHLLTVLRYVERNPLRAGLVDRAEAWVWSSLRWRGKGQKDRPVFLDDGPVDRPRGWVEEVNRPMADEELERLRRSVNRGTPWGTDTWTRRTAVRLGLEASLRPRGRPRKAKAGTQKTPKK